MSIVLHPATFARHTLCIVLALVTLHVTDVTAQPASVTAMYETLARETLQAFQDKNFDGMRDRFSNAFLSQVPLSQLNTIPTSFEAQFGKVSGVVFDEQRDDPEFAPGTLFYIVLLEGNKRSTLRMKLDADLQIVAWHLGPSFEPELTVEDLRDRFRALEGRVSVFVLEVGNARPLFSMNPDEAMAIGSAFKLYVLAEVLRQSEADGKSLNTVVRLRGWNESLPSGRLQDWPRDTPLTLQTLATMMISESDNTATDHLIDAVGRETLENQLGRLYGHSLPQRNVPFLKTRELFMLQAQEAPWDSMRTRYLAGNISAKRDVLAEMHDRTIQGMPRVTAIGNTFSKLEWFASTRNLVGIMAMLHDNTLLGKQASRNTARGILSISPGIPNGNADPRIRYLGYKGGSELGVLNLTQFVEMADDHQFIISITWNNSNGPADLNTLIPLFQSLRATMLDTLAPQAN